MPNSSLRQPGPTVAAKSVVTSPSPPKSGVAVAVGDEAPHAKSSLARAEPALELPATTMRAVGVDGDAVGVAGGRSRWSRAGEGRVERAGGRCSRTTAKLPSELSSETSGDDHDVAVGVDGDVGGDVDLAADVGGDVASAAARRSWGRGRRRRV